MGLWQALEPGEISLGESQTPTHCRASGSAAGILQMQRLWAHWVSRQFSRGVCSETPSAALVPLSLVPILCRPKAAGYAVPNTSTELLCCCHCCCCCSRNYSQGGLKWGTFSNIWISVVVKRLFVTQSDFLLGIWEGVLKPHSEDIPSKICPCSCIFLVQSECPSSSSLQLCAMS